MEKGKESKGIKHDTGKLQWGLFDINIRQELTFMRSIMTHVECDPEDFQSNVITFIGLRSYIPVVALVMQVKGVTEEDIVRIYTEGAKKYGPDNWKEVTPVSRYLSAALRHMRDGINEDDFGVSHWAHFCWNIIAMRWFEKHGSVVQG